MSSSFVVSFGQSRQGLFPSLAAAIIASAVGAVAVIIVGTFALLGPCLLRKSRGWRSNQDRHLDHPRIVSLGPLRAEFR